MYRYVLAGVLPALIAVAAGASDPQTTDRQTLVTEAEFLAVLDADHPAVAESAEALAVARTRVVAASTLANPVAGAVREDPDGPVAQTDWTLSWQPPGPGRRAGIAARRTAVEGESARLADRLLTLRLALREVYAGWAVAAGRRQRLSAQARRVETLAEREAARAERGEASGLEAHRLGLAAAALRSREALAAAAEEQARAAATAWSPELPADARPALPGLPPAPPAPPGGAAAHPRVRAAEADLAAARLERRAQGSFVTSPELSLGWQRQEAGAASIDGPTFGVAWSLPLFDRNQAQRAAAEARIAAARARLERTRREVTAERTAARAAVDRLTAAVADAEAGLRSADRMLDGAEAAFRHGETSLTDLLETYRAVSEGELAVLDLHAAALAAHRDLERLTPNSKEIRP